MADIMTVRHKLCLMVSLDDTAILHGLRNSHGCDQACFTVYSLQ
jgi:hypothetical protein